MSENCHNCGVPKEQANNWIPIESLSDKDGYCSRICQEQKLGVCY